MRRVMTQGARFRAGCLDIAWLANEAGHPRLGLVVAKFQSNAVARNRLRRRLKELWRRRGQPLLGEIDVVIRTRPAAYRATFGELSSALLGWVETAPKKV